MDKYNILVCDDDKAIVDALEIYLRQENYNCCQGIYGKAGIRGFRAGKNSSGYNGCNDA